MPYNFCPKCHKVTSAYGYDTLTATTSSFPFNYTFQPNSTATVTQITGGSAYIPSTSAAITFQQPLSVEFCTCRVEADHEAYDNAIERLHKKELDDVYTERNKCVALLVSMALGLGLNAGIGLHEDKEGEEWDDDWRHIAFIDLPSGQVSWHIHDSEMEWFKGAPKYTGKYDGHSTETKYERLLEMCKYPDDEE